MDSKTDRRIALLSIRPEYVDQILKGTKLVEFRRSSFPSSVTTGVVYCTAPVQRVVAVLRFDEVTSDTPAALWTKFRKVGGIGRREFFTYYSGSEIGRALRISSVTPLQKQLRLDEIGPAVRPPQSLRYLRPQTLERVLQFAQRAKRAQRSNE